MLRFKPAKAEDPTVVAFTCLFGVLFLAGLIAIAIHVKGFFEIAIYVFVIAIGAAQIGVLRARAYGAVCKGKLERVSPKSTGTPVSTSIASSIDSKRFEVKDECENVFDRVQQALVGISFYTEDEAEHFWTLLYSDQKARKVMYKLKTEMTDQTSAYSKIIHLEVKVFKEGADKVFVERSYKMSSPMMLKEMKEVIRQTDLFLKTVISRASISLPRTNSNDGSDSRLVKAQKMNLPEEAKDVLESAFETNYLDNLGKLPGPVFNDYAATILPQKVD